MLIQFSCNEETRTYMPCNSASECIETLVRIYETFLFNKNAPVQLEQATQLVRQSYKLDDLLNFVDQLYDLAALTFNDKAHGYTAHGKAWFKGKLHAYLRKLAADSVQQNQR